MMREQRGLVLRCVEQPRPRALRSTCQLTSVRVRPRVAREAAQDPDLWVVEIESRDGSTLLDGME